MQSPPCSRIEQEAGLRVRSSSQVVHFDVPARHTRFPLFRLDKHRKRINKFQRKWEHIKEDLPPQLSPRHIGMISIGGVIGTGLFLGSAHSLESGGPVGALLAYLIIGVVVYALCVSVGEMIAYLPNVGGVVGFTDLYVDPALGFSLGWAAWYNWSITIPCEITAATVVVQFWDPDQKYIPAPVLAGILLFLAVLVNCFSSRVYGELEFWFSTLKVLIIIIIIVACLILDIVGKRVDDPKNEWPSPIGFHTWRKSPFALNYMDISGFEGQFLGFLTVLIQATFSFFGSEVPGIAAGEVIDARRNVPRALRRVWIRLFVATYLSYSSLISFHSTLFYLGGIFCVGLLVDAKDLKIARASDPPGGPTGRSSPFVVAFGVLGVKVLPHIVNAAILISTWSAATSQIYISSRFLFFLARRGHAPAIFGTLTKFPSDTTHDHTHDHPTGGFNPTSTQRSVGSEVPRDVHSRTARDDGSFGLNGSNLEAGRVEGGSDYTVSPRPATKGPYFVLPLASVLGSASVSVFCFLGLRDLSKITSEGTTPALSFRTFTLLVSISSVASLQSWAGILFTYIRWHAGTRYAETNNEEDAKDENRPRHPEAKDVMNQINRIKRNRHWGQPYLSWYALAMCIVILIGNSWTIFVSYSWPIAVEPGKPPSSSRPYAYKNMDAISIFLSSYVPIPIFILLTFGYKLVYGSKMVRLEEMSFPQDGVPPSQQEEKPTRRWLRFLLAI